MSDAEQQAAAAASGGTESRAIDQMIDSYDGAATALDDKMKEAGRALVVTLTERISQGGVVVNQALINAALDEIDRKLAMQLDAVLHNPQFQKLESAWTGLKWLVDRTDFTQNIRFDLISVSKEELLFDFDNAVGDISTTGLYHHIYRSEYGMPGGKPYGGMIVNYEFSHRAPDMALLSKMAEVANMAHAPIISAVSPDLFGPRGMEHLTDPRFSVKEALQGKEYVKWNGFREDENARYVGLTLPRFLLRNPYHPKDNPVDNREFNYTEEINGQHENYLWGNTAFAFASRLTESFKKYRWCWRVVGEESGGAVADQKMHVFEQNGEIVQKPPTEYGITFRAQEELNESGFMPMLWLKEKDTAVFYRAPSTKLPLSYPDTPEGQEKEKNDKIRMRLPYVFILTRFAHYLKRLQTAYVGKVADKGKIAKDLNDWIKQFVNTNLNADIGKYPLYAAEILVEESPKNPGEFHCEVRLTPHGLVEGFITTVTLLARKDAAK